MTHGGLVRQSWFTHPCVSFLSCILDGVAVLDLLEPPFSFTYILGHQLQHPHSPAPRTLSFLLLPTTTPAWIHAPPPSPPPTTLCAARSIRMCVDPWMCCMDFVAMCVSGVYSGGEEDSTKVRGVSERASHRSRFLLGIVLLLLALHLLLLYWRGTSAGQGRDARGGMAARGRS